MYFNKKLISHLKEIIPTKIKKLNLEFKENSFGWVRFDNNNLLNAIYLRVRHNDEYHRPILKFDYKNKKFNFKYIYLSEKDWKVKHKFFENRYDCNFILNSKYIHYRKPKEKILKIEENNKKVMKKYNLYKKKKNFKEILNLLEQQKIISNVNNKYFKNYFTKEDNAYLKIRE